MQRYHTNDQVRCVDKMSTCSLVILHVWVHPFIPSEVKQQLLCKFHRICSMEILAFCEKMSRRKSKLTIWWQNSVCSFFFETPCTGWSKKRSPHKPIGCTSPWEKLMTAHWNITNSKFICRKSWSESLSLVQNRIFCKKSVSMGGIGICTYWQHLPLDSPSLWDN